MSCLSLCHMQEFKSLPKKKSKRHFWTLLLVNTGIQKSDTSHLSSKAVINAHFAYCIKVMLTKANLWYTYWWCSLWLYILLCSSCLNIPGISKQKCQPPADLPDAELKPEYLPKKHEYNIGDEVVYKCKTGKETTESRCLSDGSWSWTGFICGGTIFFLMFMIRVIKNKRWYFYTRFWTFALFNIYLGISYVDRYCCDCIVLRQTKCMRVYKSFQ